MEPDYQRELELIDADLVSFFDLLARFDYEDQQNFQKVSAIETTSPTPFEEVVSAAVIPADSDENRRQ